MSTENRRSSGPKLARRRTMRCPLHLVGVCYTLDVSVLTTEASSHELLAECGLLLEIVTAQEAVFGLYSCSGSS